MKTSMEYWKLILAWGCLIIFFIFPFAMISIHLLIGARPDFALEFRYMGEYLKTVTAIIISLAGFSTVEIFRKTDSGGNNK
jgi:hypothetical protein